MNASLQVAGVDVYVEGSGTETIVMVHGWPDTYRLWDAQVEALKSQYRCVRFTLPGYDINKARQAYSLEQMVETIGAVVDQTSPDQKVTLMLHDWGCFFGYQYYMQHQSRVGKIIGVDIGDVSSPAFFYSLSLAAKLMIFAYQTWLAVAWRLGGRVGDAMTRGMARLVKAFSEPQYISSAMNFPYYIQWTRTYGSYKYAKAFKPACPTLFIYGENKPFLFHAPSWAEALAAKPGNQVASLKTGHWVMREDARGFNAIVLAWLVATKG